MSDETTAESFAAIEPRKIKVSLSIGNIEVSPIRVKELPAFTQALEPFVRDIVAAGDDDIDIIGLLMGPHSEQAIQAVAIGARVSREKLDQIALDELVALAGAVIEVNFDFFIKRVIPQVSKVTEKLLAHVDGLPSLPTLSQQDSGSTK